MAIFKYNSSAVAGKDGAQEPFSQAPQRIWLDTSFSLGARAFCAWCFGKPPGWVYKVETLRLELGLTEQNWRTIATELKRRGVIKQGKKEIGNAWHWDLSFNFTVFELSTKTENQPVARRARDGLKSTHEGGCGNQHIAPAAEINELPKPCSHEEEPPQQTGGSGGGGDFAGQEDEGVPHGIEGLTELQYREVAKILADATTEQRAAALLAIIAKSQSVWAGVGDPVGYSIGMAKRALQGDRLGWTGDHLIYGVVKVIERGDFSYFSRGAILDLRGDDAQRIWQLHCDGGLDLRPPNQTIQ
jgi:hypothetical protein